MRFKDFIRARHRRITRLIKHRCAIFSTASAKITLGALALLSSSPATASELNAGDTAWMLTATALVLLMTLPGLVLFYGGAVRSKNLLSIGMQCFAIAALATVIWFVYGYSLALSGNGAYIGDLSKLLLATVTPDNLSGAIPEALYVVFQMTFAIITPVLFVGAVVERIRFSTLLMFAGLWITLVYIPICHWVWGGGWLGSLGVLDFAGGAVVHLNAGIAGLVAAIMVGKRSGYPQKPMAPNNLTLTLIGAALLWVGWFGFNAGSAVAADGSASMAMLVTQIAAATAALTWMCIEWIARGRPTPFGMVSGVISGLVAITPAAGSVSASGAFFIGLIAGIACYFASMSLKRMLGYDDSLDVFGVHGVGGAVGAVLTGVFAAEIFGGFGLGEGITSVSIQVLVQLLGVATVIVYSGVLSAALLWISGLCCGGLRVSEEQETEGLDMAAHGERAYNL